MSEVSQQAQQKLSELIDDARAGKIIPIRLPGQLEEIAALMQASDSDSQAPAPATPAPADVKTVIEEQAEFISVTVHELRNPMTSIRGYSDMMATPAMGELNDMQKQFLETIRTNVKRMESLLQDVSDMGKLRGGVLNVTEKMDMFKNIAGIVQKTVEPMAEEHGKTLTFDIASGLPLLNTDGEYFARALSKFIENSLQYTGDDGEIYVRAYADDNWLVVEIEDNGLGMTPEETAMLGTLFWRSEREAVREHKGSGLGVPIAFGVLDLIGATYHVESTPDQGTKITVRMKGMT
jgi:signal transduction histidine kinase